MLLSKVINGCVLCGVLGPVPYRLEVLGIYLTLYLKLFIMYSQNVVVQIDHLASPHSINSNSRWYVSRSDN